MTIICTERRSTTVIFLDTSYLAALAIPSDALREIALAWSKALSGPFLTTEFVVLEFVNMFSAPPRRARGNAVVESLQGNHLIEVVPASSDWMRRGLALHRERLDQSWSLTDCISFEVMRDTKTQDALTHDRHFEQAGFRALLRHAPEKPDCTT